MAMRPICRFIDMNGLGWARIESICARELPYGMSLNARPIRWQHAVEKEISFAFLVQQLGRPLVDDGLKVVGVLLKLLQNVIHYVSASKQFKCVPLYAREKRGIKKDYSAVLPIKLLYEII